MEALVSRVFLDVDATMGRPRLVRAVESARQQDLDPEVPEMTVIDGGGSLLAASGRMEEARLSRFPSGHSGEV